MTSFTYMSNPVTVEAFQFDDLGKTQMFPYWIVTAIKDGTLDLYGDKMKCKTKQGPVDVNDSDYLIRLDDGEIYPCSEAVFTSKYTKVPDVADR